MSVPKVFVSSTYNDLKEIRLNVDGFIRQMGFEPILFEKGGIAFEPNKPLDESCYEEVKKSDIYILIIGGRYGSPATSNHKDIEKGIRKYNSITKNEYLEAEKLNIPIHIFIDRNVHAEYKTYKNNKNNSNINYAHVDNPLIFALIEEIYLKRKNRFVKEYSNASEITNWLNSQWAGLFKNYIDELKKKNRISNEQARINAFKLFYYRNSSSISYNQLSNMTTIDISMLKKMELVPKLSGELNLEIFYRCNKELIEKIEKCFRMPKGETLIAGIKDDFLARFIEYYSLFKDNHIKKIPHNNLNAIPLPMCKIKAVFFDFDGTITLPDRNYTTWEKIWLYLGYEIKDCAEYQRKFCNKEITHKQWCDITKNKFREKRLSLDDVKKVARDIKLMKGLEETLESLKRYKVDMYLLSGSIKTIVYEVLGNLHEYFVDIKANDFTFDKDGILSEIYGTEYDFEGKADYISRIITEKGYYPLETLFVGNSLNDIWASQSGTYTLCVNPIYTDPTNSNQWHFFIQEMKNMKEILPYVLSKYDNFKDCV